MNSRRCDICNFDILRQSYAKHLSSKKHLGKIRQGDMNKPDWFFKEEPIENIPKNIYNLKPLDQIARENI